MKYKHICPKCNSSNIVVIDGYAGAYGSGPNLIVGSTIFSSVNKDNYICCNCGYTEEWIRKEELHKIQNSKEAHK